MIKFSNHKNNYKIVCIYINYFQKGILQNRKTSTNSLETFSYFKNKRIQIIHN